MEHKEPSFDVSPSVFDTMKWAKDKLKMYHKQ
jgi:hypothetical protein